MKATGSPSTSRVVCFARRIACACAFFATAFDGIPARFHQQTP